VLEQIGTDRLRVRVARVTRQPEQAPSQ
jgi:hypothetical protein